MCVSESFMYCLVVAMIAVIWSKVWAIWSFVSISLAVVAPDLECTNGVVLSWWVEWYESVRFYAYWTQFVRVTVVPELSFGKLRS